MAPRAGFDYEAYERALNRIRIPDKVKCKICKKIRAQNAFSKRQLGELRAAMLRCGTTGLDGPGYAGCRNCLSQQVVEMTCSICDKTKPLEYFSKCQRRDPDNARCTNCVQSHLDTDPVMDDTKLLLEDENAIDTSTYMNQTDELGINSFRALSIGNDQKLLATEGYEGTSDHTLKLPFRTSFRALGKAKEEFVARDGGVWVEQGGRFPEEKNPARAVAHDSKENKPLRIGAPPSETGESVASGWAAWSTAPSHLSRQPNPEAASMVVAPRRNQNFVKIPGCRLPKELAPSLWMPEPSGQTIESDDSDGDSDDIQNWV